MNISRAAAESHFVPQPRTPAPTWKKDDWCLFDCGVYQIQGVTPDGQVDELGDGSIRISGRSFNDRIFPMTLVGKQIADFYAAEKQQLHVKGGFLNWPDLSRKIEERFIGTMQVQVDKILLDSSFVNAREFFKEVWDAIRERDWVTVDGVRLFKR